MNWTQSGSSASPSHALLDDPTRRQALQRLVGAGVVSVATTACGGGAGTPTGAESPSAPLPSSPPPTSALKPTWQGSWVSAQTLNVQRGVSGTSLIGTVDIPSVFTVAQGDSLPAGVALTVLSGTQVRIDISATLAIGTYSFAVEATAS